MAMKDGGSVEVVVTEVNSLIVECVAPSKGDVVVNLSTTKRGNFVGTV